MKKTLLIPYILVGALCLVACRKEDAFEPVKPDTPIKVEPKEEDDNNRQLGRAYLSLTTTAEELDDLRGIDLIQTDRPGKEGEVLPRLNLQPGSREQVYLILVKDGDKASIHRQVLDFTVLPQSDERAGGKANVLHFSGYVSLPEGYKLSDGTWYAMAILNMDMYNADNEPSNTLGEAGAMVAFGRRHRLPSNGQVSASTGDHALIRHEDGSLSANVYNVPGVPYLSQWQQLSLANSPKAGEEPSYRVEGLQMKPQGLLLHYELGIDVAQPMAIRRYGLASNALAFSGYYDMDADHLYAKFSGRDKVTGIAYPDWQEDTATAQGLSIHYSAEQASLSTLRDAERSFPWDLPTLSQDYVPQQGGQDYPERLNLSASLSTTVVLPRTVQAWWEFWLTGKGYHSRRSLLFWAMPRKQRPQIPFTYLWAGIYSHKGEASNPFPQDFVPIERIGAKVVGELNKHRRELRVLEHEIRIKKQMGEQVQSLEASLASKRSTYNNAFEAYKRDSVLYYDTYQPNFITNTTVHAQPTLVLHQSNQSFEAPERQQRVHHIRTLLTSDLMLTEVLHHKEGERNYSMLEFYNPTTKPLDLNQYAVVRLSRAGNAYAFRRADGSTSDRLGDCVASQDFLELKKVLRPHILVGNPSSSRGYTVNRGIFTGERWYTDLWAVSEAEEKTLLPEQTFVLGASGYQELEQGNTIKPAWWVDTEHRLQTLANDEADALRAMAYSTSPIMDLEQGEGWALLKRYGDKWQVIDATAPIGMQGYAFAATPSAYLYQMSSLGSTYSMRRHAGVSFPFIPPYRTRRLSTDWSDDWVATSGLSTHTLGSRLSERASYEASNGQLQVHYPTWLRERTPLDERYSTYWQNRPHTNSKQAPALSPKSTAKPSPGGARQGNDTATKPSIGAGEPSPESYSVAARAGKTWWVQGVNASAPSPASWKEVVINSGIKGLKWDRAYGWYDLNKTEPHNGGTDSDLCWAAVSANVLQWWLEQNKSYVDRYNYNGPRVFTDSYRSEIFDLYKKYFRNKGGDLKASIDWFFNGKYAHQALAGGGFFTRAFGEDFRPVVQIGAHESSFSEDVAKTLKSGEALCCDLQYPRGYLHALSVWGADFDASGRVTHLYITDSNDKDDEQHKDTDRVTSVGLLRRAIQLRDGSVWREGAVRGVFNFRITRLYKLGLHQDKWEAYFAKQAR